MIPVVSASSSNRQRGPVWLFDLDDTLHHASHGLLPAIHLRMTEYLVEHLALTESDADRMRAHYWRRYGATLLGLVRHHGIDARHFLQATHDVDIASLLRTERGLARMLARLPGRKVLLTNAPRAYAATVLRGLAIHRHLRTHYAVESMRVHGSYRPKPSRLMLRAMLARERVRPCHAVLIEDSAVNLKAARALGLRTVLMTGHRARGLGIAPRARAGYVGLRIRTLHALPRFTLRIRR